MRALLALLILLPFIVVAQQDTDSGPAVVHSAITPHNSNTLTNPNGTLRCRAVYVGGEGDLSMIDVEGNTVTWAAVPGGTVLPFGPRIVRATGTTATNLVCIGR